MGFRTRLAFVLMRWAARLDLVVVLVVSESIVLSMVEGIAADGRIPTSEERAQWRDRPKHLN